MEKMEDIKDIWKHEHLKTKKRIRKDKINKELHQRRLNVQKRDQISNEEVPEEPHQAFQKEKEKREIMLVV